MVVSPKHVAMMDRREARKPTGIDGMVICRDGGETPLIRKERRLRGVEAGIDKGLSNARLSGEINTLIVPSGVRGAAITTRLAFNVIGMDIVEGSPPYDQVEITALVAKTRGRALLYVLAANRKERWI